MSRLSVFLVSAAIASSAPLTAHALPLNLPVAAKSDIITTEIHYRPFAHRHRDRPYYREYDSRPRTDSDAGPRERPDLYRAFDRERIYTDGIARGPNGDRKLRPAFRDGRTFTIIGN